MWLFTTLGFYSMTVSKTDSSKMQFRGRAKEDIVSLAELALEIGVDGEIVETLNADYRWRFLVAVEDAPRIVVDLANRVTYSNFKAQIKDNYRHGLYSDVWSTMLQLQSYERRWGNFRPVQPNLPGEGEYDGPWWGADAGYQEPKSSAAVMRELVYEEPAEPDDQDDPTSPFYDPARQKATLPDSFDPEGEIDF